MDSELPTLDERIAYRLCLIAKELDANRSETEKYVRDLILQSLDDLAKLIEVRHNPQSRDMVIVLVQLSLTKAIVRIDSDLENAVLANLLRAYVTALASTL